MASEQRLIDALDLWTDIMMLPHNGDMISSEEVEQAIVDAPTVDAAEVVHGRWVDHMVRDWRCSECGDKIHKVRKVDGYCYNDLPNYCPQCGAKMDGERKDNERKAD